MSWGAIRDERDDDKVISIYDTDKELRDRMKEIEATAAERNPVWEIYPVITEDEVTFEEGFEYVYPVSKAHRANIINHIERFGRVTRYIYDIWHECYLIDPASALKLIRPSDDGIIEYFNGLYPEYANTGMVLEYRAFSDDKPSVEDSLTYFVNLVMQDITKGKSQEHIIDAVMSFTDLRTINVAVNKVFGFPSHKNDWIVIEHKDDPPENQKLYDNIKEDLRKSGYGELVDLINSIENIEKR